MREMGVQPIYPKAGDFKSPVYSNSTTLAEHVSANVDRPIPGQRPLIEPKTHGKVTTKSAQDHR